MTALDGFPFSVFITSTDLRNCISARGHDLPKSANTIKAKVCDYAASIKEKVIAELGVDKNGRFSLCFDEWTSTSNKRYLNVNIFGCKKWWNVGLIRIRGIFSAEKCIEVLSSKLLEFNLSLESNIVGFTTEGAQ